MKAGDKQHRGTCSHVRSMPVDRSLHVSSRFLHVFPLPAHFAPSFPDHPPWTFNPFHSEVVGRAKPSLASPILAFTVQRLSGNFKYWRQAGSSLGLVSLAVGECGGWGRWQVKTQRTQKGPGVKDVCSCAGFPTSCPHSCFNSPLCQHGLQIDMWTYCT